MEYCKCDLRRYLDEPADFHYGNFGTSTLLTFSPFLLVLVYVFFFCLELLDVFAFVII
jgi:hypothetical protein